MKLIEAQLGVSLFAACLPLSLRPDGSQAQFLTVFLPLVPFHLNSFLFEIHVNHCFPSTDGSLTGPRSGFFRDRKGDSRGPTFRMDHTNDGFCDLQQSLYKPGTLVSYYHQKARADFLRVLYVVPLVPPSGAPSPETEAKQSAFTPWTLGRLTGASIQRG